LRIKPHRNWFSPRLKPGYKVSPFPASKSTSLPASLLRTLEYPNISADILSSSVLSLKRRGREDDFLFFLLGGEVYSLFLLLRERKRWMTRCLAREVWQTNGVIGNEMGSRGIEGRGRKTTVVIRFGAISSGFFCGWVGSDQICNGGNSLENELLPRRFLSKGSMVLEASYPCCQTWIGWLVVYEKKRLKKT